jgi:hypothetical protein
MSCAKPGDGTRLWRTADAVHVDVRGLEPPDPMILILQLVDGGGLDSPVIAHLDREPIFLYPELDDRGWAYEILPNECGDPACENEVLLQLVRLRS